MANRPIPTPLPADLPQNWTTGQTVAPTGAEVGLSQQHGYNYQSKQINDAQVSVNLINAAFDGLVPTTRKINGEALTGDINLTPTKVGADPAGSASVVQANLTSHVDNMVRHITAEERALWNAKRPNIIRTHPIATGNTVSAGDVVDVVGGEVQGRRPVGALPVGTIIKIPENGVPTDYVIVNQGRPSAMYDVSCDGTWIVRKSLLSLRPWNNIATNDYENSAIKAWLDSTFISMLGGVAGAVKQVKIPYRPGTSGTVVNSGANGLSCKAFLLSVRELGFSQASLPSAPADGAKLAYFIDGNTGEANAQRVATENGEGKHWWTRSPVTSGSDQTYVQVIYPNGGGGGVTSPTNNMNVRPAMVLDPTFKTDYYLPYSQAIALQSGTAGQSIDIIYDGVAELPGITAGTQITSPGVQGYAPQDGWLWVRPEWEGHYGLKVAIGTYVGTGTFGVGNKNTLTFDFEPQSITIYHPTIGDSGGSPWGRDVTVGRSHTASSSVKLVTLEWTGNNLSWYGESASFQLNTAGIVYRFVAIGTEVPE